LVEHFLKKMNAKGHLAPKRVSPDVMRKLLDYRWPGNVRELSHALERMMVLADSDLLAETDLPDEIRESIAGNAPIRDLPTGLTMDELEKLAITKALDACDGNRTHAAQRLNISVRTLQRKLQQYQLERKRRTGHDTGFGGRSSQIVLIVCQFAASNNVLRRQVGTLPLDRDNGY